MSSVGEPDTHKAAVLSEAVQPCAVTRSELTTLLKESDYGRKVDAYTPYFARDEHGRHVCDSCRLPIAAHAAEPQQQPAVAHRPPDVVLGRSPDGYTKLLPLHWVGAPWYLGFLTFVGYGGHHVETRTSSDSRFTATFVTARWRCNAPKPDGTPCNATFVTKGALIGAKGSVSGAIDLTPLQPADKPIESHYEDVHKLRHVPAGAWSTSLARDACSHRNAALSCVCCYFCCEPCDNGLQNGRGFFNALDQVAPFTEYWPGEGRPVVQGAPEDAAQWTPRIVDATVLWLGFYGLLVPFVYPVVLAWDILVCAGFPCDSSKLPPLHCCPCFQRRRRFVRALAADESLLATRCIVCFCWPCSELQMWREAVHSGVWPGLMCCEASEADRATLGDVRRRYSVDDGAYYAVRPSPAASHNRVVQELAASVRREEPHTPIYISSMQ